MKLFVSSSSIKSKNIIECVKLLISIGVSNIELSGGTNYDSFDIEELIKFKVDNSLNYMVHNYFPPVPKPFVLNLASSSEENRSKAVEFCKNSIVLSKRFNHYLYRILIRKIQNISLNIPRLLVFRFIIL